MAQIIRKPRLGKKWSVYELMAFNITVDTVDVQTFFNMPQLPPTNVSPVILNNLDPPASAVLTKDEYHFFTYLERTEYAYDHGRVDDFIGHILRMLNFDDVAHSRSLVLKKELWFTMCGENVYATPDYTVIENDKYILLVQESKQGMAYEPQEELIAGAIGAFVQNDVWHGHHPRVAQDTLFGITIVRSGAPIFYKIPITLALVTALITAQYPTQPTIVQRFAPPVADLQDLHDYGMRPLDNRLVVFQCFEAMRDLMSSSELADEISQITI